MNWIIENWLIIATTAISIASVVAKITPNETDNKIIAMIQKFVDTIAMSSKPTELKKPINLDEIKNQ